MSTNISGLANDLSSIAPQLIDSLVTTAAGSDSIKIETAGQWAQLSSQITGTDYSAKSLVNLFGELPSLLKDNKIIKEVVIDPISLTIGGILLLSAASLLISGCVGEAPPLPPETSGSSTGNGSSDSDGTTGGTSGGWASTLGDGDDTSGGTTGYVDPTSGDWNTSTSDSSGTTGVLDGTTGADDQGDQDGGQDQ